MEKVLSQRTLKSADIRANASIESDEERVFFRHFLKADRDMLSMASYKFGNPLLYVNAYDNSVIVYDPRGGVFYSGNSFKSVSFAIIGMEIGLEDLFESMTGGVYLPEGFKISQAYLINKRYIKVIYEKEAGEGIERHVTVSPGDIIMEVIIRSAEQSLIINYGNHKVLEGISMPRRISILKEDPFTRVTFKIKKLSLNISTGNAAPLIIPDGVVPLSIEDMPRLF
jgi:hypothetical protein